jgi:hypothetical protein
VVIGFIEQLYSMGWESMKVFDIVEERESNDILVV